MSIHAECFNRFENEVEYMGRDKPVNQLTPVVSVCVATYQHKKYIRHCLDGILMQQTSFAVEIIVGEDGSTDGTRKICIQYAEKFPGKIRLFLRDRNTSQYHDEKGNFICRFNGPWTRMAARGKYIAICEGDDYWIDPFKLQKQADFLDEHLEYGLVFTDINMYDQARGVYRKAIFHNGILPVYTNFTDHLVNRGFLAPCTWLCRRELQPDYQKIYCDGSFAWLLDVFMTSRIFYMDEVTAVYRIVEESASHSKSRSKMYAYKKGVFEIQQDYILKYKLPEAIKNSILFENYMDLSEDAFFCKDDQFIAEGQLFLENQYPNAGLLVNELYKTKIEYFKLKSNLDSLKKSNIYRLMKLMKRALSYIKAKTGHSI